MVNKTSSYKTIKLSGEREMQYPLMSNHVSHILDRALTSHYKLLLDQFCAKEL